MNIDNAAVAGHADWPSCKFGKARLALSRFLVVCVNIPKQL